MFGGSKLPQCVARGGAGRRARRRAAGGRQLAGACARAGHITHPCAGAARAHAHAGLCRVRAASRAPATLALWGRRRVDTGAIEPKSNIP